MFSWNNSILSWHHIIWLVVLLTAGIVAAILITRKFGFSKKVLVVCLIIMIICEAVHDLYFVEKAANGLYYLPTDRLPLDLCGIQIIFVAILAFSKKENLKKYLTIFMYPTCFAGAAMAFFIPTSPLSLGFWSLIAFEYFIFHLVVFFVGLYILLARPVKFNVKTYGNALIMLVSCLFVGNYLNTAFGGGNSNYFFVAGPPIKGLPLLNLNNGWHMYILALALIAVVLVTVLYIPIFIQNRILKKRELATKSDIQKNV